MADDKQELTTGTTSMAPDNTVTQKISTPVKATVGRDVNLVLWYVLPFG